MGLSLSMARISVLSHFLLVRMLLDLLCVSFCYLEMVFDQTFESFFTFGNSQSLFLCTFIPYIFFSFSILEFLVASWGPSVLIPLLPPFLNQGTTLKTFCSVAVSILLFSQQNH